MSTIKRHMLNMCMKYNTAGFIWFESCRVAVFLNEQAKMPKTFLSTIKENNVVKV